MALWAAGMMTLGLTPSPHLPLRAAAHGSRGATPRLAVREVVVVGGGWAGYAAADALSASGDCHVTLLEASPRAAGGLAGGWRTPGGRPVEAGIHGFWRYYTNTLAVLESIGLDADDVLTFEEFVFMIGPAVGPIPVSKCSHKKQNTKLKTCHEIGTNFGVIVRKAPASQSES